MSEETMEPSPRGSEPDAEHLRSSALIPAAAAPAIPSRPPPAPPTPSRPPPAPASSPSPPVVARGAASPAAPAVTARSPAAPPVGIKAAPVTPRPVGTVRTSSSDLSSVPRPQAPRTLHQPVTPRPPSSSDLSRAAAEAAQLPVLSAELRDQLAAVLAASLESTLAPLLEKQRELEARLAALRAGEPSPETALAVAKAPSLPPPRAPIASLPIEVVASVPPSLAPKATTTVRSTSYGLVIDAGASRPPPAIEQALANVGPIDVPDFGGGRRRAGRVLVFLLLAGFVAVIVATILSYH